jgi:heme A synthase
MLARFDGVTRLARIAVLSTFGLVVLGAVVRSTGSGLACPDWPLCHGRILPPLQPHVLLEWSHRAVALGVSLLCAALALRIAVDAALRRTLGGWMALALGLLALQVVLGALTVWKLLHFSVVTLHLGNALLFLAALVALAERASRAGEAGVQADEGAARGGRRVWIVAAVATLGQILLGGLVSTNHAGLACPDFPLCHGAWWPLPGARLEHLQMTHRVGAFVLLALLVVAWARSRDAADPRVRAAGPVALSLVLVQLVLGVFAVLLAVPVWLTAAHLATATALWVLVVLTALRAAAPGGAR